MKVCTRRVVVWTVAVTSIAFAAGCGWSEPSENEIRARFMASRVAFERLRVLVDEPPRIDHVDGDVVFRTANDELGAPVPSQDARIAEVRRLMHATGVTRVMYTRDALAFELWHSGMLHGSDLKGLAFAPHRLSTTVQSVDDPKRHTYGESNEIFSAIEGNWYVWFAFGN